MSRYRKRPVEIEAEQYRGDGAVRGLCHFHPGSGPHVHTIHDDQRVDVVVGDWIIPEPDGVHFYPCKHAIFEATYEPADGESVEDLARRLIASKHFVPDGQGGDWMSWDILAEDALRERLGMGSG